MKILQLTFSLTSGGAEKFTVDLANEIAKTDEVFFYVILSEKYKEHSFFKTKIKKNINYINLECTKGLNFKTFFSIFKIINKVKPDVIHFHLNTILYLYLPAIFFKNKIKFIHTLHSLTPKTIGFKWQRSINKFFYKRDLIKAVTISQENKFSFKEFYGHKKVTLIENGVANSNKTDKFENVKEELNKLKKNRSDRIFIHIGGYIEAKNQELLIKVFNRLIEEDQGVILIVIGKYFDSEGAKQLKNISNPGIFYLGTRKNISDYLLNSDVFVLSSLWEGLPISLLEAISCGVIPVSTPAGGIPDVIINEMIGYLSKDFTEQGLYDATIKCLNNIVQFDRDKLKNYFNSNFSIERCAFEYKNIYNS